MPCNKVLIPLDGTAFSERILPVVRRHLLPAQNELILYLVTEYPAGGDGGVADLVANNALHDEIVSRLSPAELDFALHPIYTSQVEEGVALDLELKLMPLADELRADGYSVSTEVSFGDPKQAIDEFIRYRGIDLVAMTTHGRTGLRRAPRSCTTCWPVALPGRSCRSTPSTRRSPGCWPTPMWRACR